MSTSGRKDCRKLSVLNKKVKLFLKVFLTYLYICYGDIKVQLWWVQTCVRIAGYHTHNKRDSLSDFFINLMKTWEGKLWGKHLACKHPQCIKERVCVYNREQLLFYLPNQQVKLCLGKATGSGQVPERPEPTINQLKGLITNRMQLFQQTSVQNLDK